MHSTNGKSRTSVGVNAGQEPKPEAQHIISLRLNERAYKMLEFHASESGPISLEEAVREAVASHVFATVQSFTEEECNAIFEIAGNPGADTEED